MDQWPKEITPYNFDQEVLRAPRPTLVVFLKQGVASGDILVAVLKRCAQEVKADINYFRADVDKCQEIASRYRINKIPMTFLFIGGKVRAHFFGVMSTQRVRGILKDIPWGE